MPSRCDTFAGISYRASVSRGQQATQHWRCKTSSSHTSCLESATVDQRKAQHLSPNNSTIFLQCLRRFVGDMIPQSTTFFRGVMWLRCWFCHVFARPESDGHGQAVKIREWASISLWYWIRWPEPIHWSPHHNGSRSVAAAWPIVAARSHPCCRVLARTQVLLHHTYR